MKRRLTQIVVLTLDEYLEHKRDRIMLNGTLGVPKNLENKLKEVMKQSFDVKLICSTNRHHTIDELRQKKNQLSGAPIAYLGAVQSSWGVWVWACLTDKASTKLRSMLRTMRLEIGALIRDQRLFTQGVYAFVMEDSPKAAEEIKFLKAIGFVPLEDQWFKDTRPVNEKVAHYFIYDYVKYGSRVRKKVVAKNEYELSPFGYLKRDRFGKPYRYFTSVSIPKQRKPVCVDPELQQSTTRRTVDTSKLENFAEQPRLFSKSSGQGIEYRERPPSSYRGPKYAR